MTNEELDRLEAVANAATPGPWRPCPQKSFIFGPAHEMVASRLRSPGDDEPEEGTVEIRGFGGGLPMDANHDFIVATSPDVVLRLVAELRVARDALDVALDLEVERDDARESRDRLAAELTEARAEIERLRAMVPSKEIVSRIRTSVEYDCEDHGCDISEDFWRPVGEWLSRIESAKGAGR